MTVETVMLLVLTLSVTSLASRDGDLLQDACEEACQDWEDLRRQCFKSRCQKQVARGEDWFPCFLTCWNHSRPCLFQCANNFWKTYARCSRQCLGRTGKKRRKCRLTCAVGRFAAVKKRLVMPKIPRIKVTVDKPQALGNT